MGRNYSCRTLEYRNKMSLLKGGRGDITAEIPCQKDLRNSVNGKNHGYQSVIFLKSRYKLPPLFLFGSANPAWRGGKIRKICSECGGEIFITKWRAKRAKQNFCSPNCSLNHRNRLYKREGHPNWRGGATSIFSRIRNSNEYKIWRKSVFERDGFRCLVCGKVGGNINVHHIKPFSEITKQFDIKTFEDAKNCIDLWLPENGITLCVECHKLQHQKD